MQHRALIVGDPGRTPFVGHLRALVQAERAWLAAAGRIAAGAGPEGAWGPARALEAAIAGVARKGDRNSLLWRAWEAVGALPGDALGPAQGQDLALLLLAGDEAGVGVAGVGLRAVWALGSGGLSPLVSGRHPLLAPPGRPAQTPGVLTLDAAPDSVVGVPAHHDSDTLSVEGLLARCGVRR